MRRREIAAAAAAAIRPAAGDALGAAILVWAAILL
jgi:hypothetical protein